MSGPKERLFESKEVASRQRLVSFLRDLANKMEQDQFHLERDGSRVAVTLPDEVELEIELDSKTKPGGATKHSLEIEIEWTEGGARGRVSVD
jgi:amphi-Trp domain-containing protein